MKMRRAVQESPGTAGKREDQGALYMCMRLSKTKYKMFLSHCGSLTSTGEAQTGRSVGQAGESQFTRISEQQVQ